MTETTHQANASGCSWKENWGETKQRFTDWWNRKGIVVSAWGPAPSALHADVEEPPKPASVEDGYADGRTRALRNHYNLARRSFPAEALPISSTDIGPGSLALFLGSEPGFSPETVWFEPCMMEEEEPENLPPLKFDPHSRWWKVTEETCRACADLARGNYLVGCPDLVENIDILAALRDPQTLMMDMIERPEWVEKKMWEINDAFFEAYGRIYDIIKLADGSSAFGAFSLWGPGKTAKVQCDASAMFSPDMFERFVTPALAAQCEWLDHSMFHLDGTQCICHLDHLMSIDALDALEWTPQAGLEGGGHPRWYDIYKRVLDAGKSVQVMGAKPEEIAPLLDAIGTDGIYMVLWINSEDELKQAMDTVERYRK